jgi:hypothetical protein
MKLKNLYLALKDQMPVKRFFINFVVTRNAWGLFHKNSHIRGDGNGAKVMYNTRKSAERARDSMIKKYEKSFSVYKCVHCDGYHVGKNNYRRQKMV